MTEPGSPVEEVLDVREVDITRAGSVLLSAVSLRIRAGEHWALLGPNGAGKSTLLSLAGARVHPSRGEVHVLGHRLGRVDMRSLRTRLGHVDPRHQVQRPLPLRDVILSGLDNTPEPDPRRVLSDDQLSRVETLAASVDLGHRLDRTWTQSSQGERTRALIARALMPQPQLLLLDEPATGLDLAGREQLLSGLARVASTTPGLASITVTHHLEDLPPHTSHALLLKQGRVLCAGPVDDVLDSESVSDCFDLPVSLSRVDGRWLARSRSADAALAR